MRDDVRMLYNINGEEREYNNKKVLVKSHPTYFMHSCGGIMAICMEM